MDRNKALDGDDLRDFVNLTLFPYLKKFKDEEPNTIEYKIGEIFSELKNRITSGYKLREISNIVDGMHFRLYEEKRELSHLYEAKIKNMGNAGRNGGEYYTPRLLIKTIMKVVNPKIGDTIYDGACGSAGFLVETYNYLTQDQAKGKGSAQDNLNMAKFENEYFPIPPTTEQKEIVAKLDALAAETGRLEGIYKQKLADLEELKKSVLRKAFSEEL